VDELTFRLEDMLGHCKLVSVQKRIGDKIYLGGYTIYYDQYGVERNRSEVRWNVTVDCGDVETAMSLDKQSKSEG
jgi:hypothetical protein